MYIDLELDLRKKMSDKESKSYVSKMESKDEMWKGLIKSTVNIKNIYFCIINL